MHWVDHANMHCLGCVLLQKGAEEGLGTARKNVGCTRFSILHHGRSSIPVCLSQLLRWSFRSLTGATCFLLQWRRSVERKPRRKHQVRQDRQRRKEQWFAKDVENRDIS